MSRFSWADDARIGTNRRYRRWNESRDDKNDSWLHILWFRTENKENSRTNNCTVGNLNFRDEINRKLSTNSVLVNFWCKKSYRRIVGAFRVLNFVTRELFLGLYLFSGLKRQKIRFLWRTRKCDFDGSMKISLSICNIQHLNKTRPKNASNRRDMPKIVSLSKYCTHSGDSKNSNCICTDSWKKLCKCQ